MINHGDGSETATGKKTHMLRTAQVEVLQDVTAQAGVKEEDVPAMAQGAVHGMEMTLQPATQARATSVHAGYLGWEVQAGDEDLYTDYPRHFLSRMSKIVQAMQP